MLNSMTGYGRSEKQNGLPKFLSALELPLKKLIKSKCSRGSFDLFLTLEKEDAAGADLEIKPNLGLAKQYFEAFKKIKDELGLAGDMPIEALLGVKDIIKTEPLTLDTSQEEMILETVEEAMSALINMRQEEGNNLQKDLAGRLQDIHQLVQTIQERQPVVLEEYRNRLNDKIKTLTEGLELDETRLAQETALMADRCDISEEITRLGSHFEQFNSMFEKSGPIGRKMEFVTQEINRETNTIGSKSVDYQVSQSVIEIKSLLEKIREQIQNIE